MLTDNLIRRKRTICFLTSDICLLISVRCPLSITSASAEPGKAPKCGLNPYMPNEPNFQKSRLSVTLDLIRTYNANCPKKHKKSEPNPNPMQTQSKPDPNPNQTQTKPNFVAAQ